MRMLVKCETKSNRVKGMSFHPRQAWVLASLHNGTIQLWDYRIGTLIEKFEEHEGPVRGVCFHMSQSLFVSGGDDYKIKVWNYQYRRCIFTLLGHLDYIRTVQFHHEYPWICSASDDQTIRLWNWQNRSCVAVLTGHNHYVMSALFHPRDDLIVSSSLDQTVRVWDTGSLREKTLSIGGGGVSAVDVFGSNDASVKHVMEGHDRGVNWACFHPTEPLVASVADDRVVKLWRMSDSKAWEMDTLRGHFNNVSCVAFSNTKDILVSNSEDKTIRVWDKQTRSAIHTFRRENDRFWCITHHPTKNLLAVGHDSGMVVFKLDRERPAAMSHGSTLYYVSDRYLTSREMDGVDPGAPKSLGACRRATNAMVSGIRSLEFNVYNTAEISILVQYDQDGSGYDIFTGTPSSHHEASLQSKQGSGLSCCFTARNRFAVLLKENQIGIYNLQNELSKSFDAPVPTSAINPGGSNRVMLRGDDRASLYDLTSRKVVASCSIPTGTRYVVWSPNMAYVAFIAKTSIVACTKNLERLHTVHETTRIKSGAWDENGVFIYATQSHVNYMIPKTGDSATIHSIEQPIYITRAHKNHYTYLDRSNQAYRKKFDPTEFLFKIALYEKRFADVKTYLKSARLCGNAIIGYLKRHGHPEVALHFVEDPATRFNLALEYGHLDEAIPAAKTLDNPTIWSRLGKEALRQGNQIIVEMVYQKTKHWDGLTFLYAITGNRTKLEKMLRIAEKRNDVMARYHNALMCGLVEQRVKLLAEMGQVPLAALTARTHGLTEFVESLEESMGHDVAAAVRPDAKLLLPPIPVGGEIVNSPEGANWPVITDIAKTFENTLANAEVAAANAPPPPEPEPDFADALEQIDNASDDDPGAIADMGAWGGDDLGLDGAELADIPDIPMDNHHSGVNMGETASAKWLKTRKLLPDLVAAGAFGEALHFLKLRIGLINAAPLERPFMHAYIATQGTYLPGLPAAPAISIPLLAEGNVRGRSCAPYALFNYGAVVEMQKEAAKLTTQGKFTDALAAYRSLLQSLVLAVATTPEEERGLQDMVVSCKEYVLGMGLEVTRKTLGADQVARNLELVAYFTCCKLAPAHMTLILRVAMLTHFKAQNYITSAYFARRLLSGGTKVQPDLAKQAKQVLANCEQKATDSHAINFDIKVAGNDGNLTLCSGSLKPIPATAATVQCPYCQAEYSPEYSGKLCDICQLAEIGAKTLGLQFRPITMVS